jgi:hypothetical protein
MAEELRAVGLPRRAVCTAIVDHGALEIDASRTPA